MFSQDSQTPAGHFLGWTPGRGPNVSPPGMPWLLERGSDLVVQLHLVPSGKHEDVRVSVGLFFTQVPPTEIPLMIKLGSKTIDIPAGEQAYEITATYLLPVDIDVLGVFPHAHYLATDIQALATLPDGTVVPLIRIRRWNFHWQQDYRYARPLRLPRGTEVRMKYRYDNSEENPMNPHHPPQRVTYGPKSSDEMGDLWLQVVPRSPNGYSLLLNEFLDRDAQANVAAGEMLVRREPGIADNHAFLGSSYLRVGRIEEATKELEEALRLNPRHVDAHNSLGEALLSQGRTADAIVHLRRALALDPRNDGLHFNLANALHADGHVAEAAGELRMSLELNPDFAEAHYNLGVLLLGSGNDLEVATTHFQRAIAIRPDYAEAHNGLAAAFGEMGKFDEAILHVRQALEISPSLPGALTNLQSLLATNSNRINR
jgi:prepilin-type processing-associated H-X9-DG protein